MLTHNATQALRADRAIGATEATRIAGATGAIGVTDIHRVASVTSSTGRIRPAEIGATSATSAAGMTGSRTARVAGTGAASTAGTAGEEAGSLWFDSAATWFLDLTPVRSFLAIYTDLFESLIETLYMVGVSSLLSLFFGFLLAIVMIMTGPHGLNPAPRIYRVLDLSVNIFRSLPFIILIIAIMPLTRFVMNTTIGTSATILPLTIAAAPFAARLIEGTFLEVDKGVIEAARSFGATRWQIIMRVMLPEALPAIVLNAAVLAITLIGYSAMAGTVGGGGLGDLAYRFGYQRFQTDATVWCIIVLILLVQAIQSLGNWAYTRLRSTTRTAAVAEEQ